MKYTLRLEVRNQPGILARVAGLFNRRAYNIESFSSGRIKESVYGMTIGVICDEDSILHIKMQLERLIDVIQVEILNDGDLVDYEIVLIKTNGEYSLLNDTANQCDITLINTNENQMVYRCCGQSFNIEKLINNMNQNNIISINRSGSIAI